MGEQFMYIAAVVVIKSTLVSQSPRLLHSLRSGLWFWKILIV